MAVSDSTHRMATADVMDRIKAIAGTEADAPVTMLNLNRYTAAADFPNGSEYERYMADLEAAVGNVGGSVLWRTPVAEQVIGCDHERYDEMLAVWYPSRKAFLALPTADRAQQMFAGRKICVEQATILELAADKHPFSR
jgi:hypothetical protein